MRFEIDGQPINTRTDWRHQTKPTPAPRIQYQTPGNVEIISLVEPATPPDILVAGFLFKSAATPAEAISLLDDQILELNLLKGDGLLHTLSIHNRAYLATQIIECGTTGDYTAADGGVRIGYMFQFRLLRSEVEILAEEGD